MNNLIRENKKLFDTFFTASELTKENIEEAILIFNLYYEKGVFQGCSFTDNKWNTTDEYSNVGLRFNFDELSYNRYYKEIFGLSHKDFIDNVKVYVIFSLGKLVLKTLQTTINDLKRIIKIDSKKLYAATTSLKLAVPSLCLDFFTLLPIGSESGKADELFDVLEQYIFVQRSTTTKTQRNLAQFDSYFLFHDIISDYWSGDLKKEERLFFYPLYLWWQITGVIPLRPKEFILTSRDCLKKEEDGYYLTLRRNKLKGAKKNVAYKILDDYDNSSYKIPDKLAGEILTYLDFTMEFENTELDTLFVSDTHYRKWNHKKHSNSRYLTYINMNTIMRYFFHEVIENQYGISVIYGVQKKRIKENEINYLHLGDTRHLALINIIAEGGTPLTAMLLAGHETMDMSAHYYSNITNLIECRTYRQYRLITKGEVSYQISTAKKIPVKVNDDFSKLADGGRCYSEKYRNSDFSDCLETSGKAGELGYCPSCKYFRKPNRSYYSSDSMYKRKIYDDSKNLESAVRLVRTGKGNTEDIGEALLKLKSSTYSYEEYFKEKTAKREGNGEKIWEEKN